MFYNFPRSFNFSLAREYAQEAEHEYSDKLKRIQTIIIDLTSAISKCGDKNQKPIPNVYTKELEDWISEYSKHLPPPEQYIIPVRSGIFLIVVLTATFRGEELQVHRCTWPDQYVEEQRE